MATNENLPPNVIKQLAKELKGLDETPPEGIKVTVNEDDFSTIFADIEGPAGTPYENGVFRMKLILSHDFPHSPPKALNEQAGKMLIENYEEYAKHARLYTGIHAKPKLKSKAAGISESTTVLNAGQPNAAAPDQRDTMAPAAMPLSPTTASTGPTPTLKKEAGPVKVAAADKKKVDATKKSLRRL